MGRRAISPVRPTHAEIAVIHARQALIHNKNDLAGGGVMILRERFHFYWRPFITPLVSLMSPRTQEEGVE